MSIEVFKHEFEGDDKKCEDTRRGCVHSSAFLAASAVLTLAVLVLIVNLCYCALVELTR